MEFAVSGTYSGCRLGLLTLTGCSPVRQLKTPMCVVYTRSGRDIKYLIKTMIALNVSLPYKLLTQIYTRTGINVCTVRWEINL